MSNDPKTEPETATRGAYGSHLANCFGLIETPSYVQRTLQRGVMAASHLTLAQEREELTGSVKSDNAFLVVVHRRDLVHHELWLDDRLVSRAPAKAGETHLYNLDQDPRARVFQPAEALHFYFPRASLEEFAEEHGLKPVSELTCTPGVGVADPVMAHISQVVITALEHPAATTGLLLDHLLNGACARVLAQYSRTGAPPGQEVQGLAAWQERRAKEMMETMLDVSLPQVAQSCRLSVTQFVRAFRRSTGVSPHQWLIRQRVDKAMGLLRDPKRSIVEVALLAGFSSQSHLNTVFAAHVGMPPGRWRRLQGVKGKP